MIIRSFALSEVNDGDILAEDLFNESGGLFITKGTQLNKFLLEKISELGIIRVNIYIRNSQEPASEEEVAYGKFVESYDENVGSIKKVINELALGKNPDLNVVNDITDSIYNELNSKNNIIKCLSSVKAFDEYTYNHSINVSLYAMLIGTWLNFDEVKIKQLVTAGLLHDIGKSSIPIEILNKSGKLTDTEFEVMKKHPAFGYNIAKRIPDIPRSILAGVLFHHEREDGKGYPMKLPGSTTDVFAKIIAVADVFDALTSERVYKKRITPFDTFKIFEQNGIGHFDIGIMMTFMQNIANYYIGSKVVLSNGRQGKVVYVPPQSIYLPLVQIGNEYIDLSKNKEIKISDIVE